MPFAARVGDTSAHGGTVTGPGSATVLIGGMPAAIAGDMHACVIQTPPPHGATPIALGSATVHIGGRPAVRVGDTAGCGATIVVGAATVEIGG